jgi:tetratricopeptide (TPR) repeat protein
MLLLAQGELPGARTLSERALAIYESTMGPDHPDTATSLNDLARVLHADGDTARARTLFERAAIVFDKTLGPAHPNSNRVRTNLAQLQLSKNAPAEALPLAEAALAAHNQILGADHPWTKDSARVVARSLEALDRPDAAAAVRANHGIEEKSR